MRSDGQALQLGVCLLSFALRPCYATDRYTFAASGVTYTECRSQCLAARKQLPCVRNSEENAAMVSFMRAGGYHRAWIGYTDVAEEGTWVWEPGCHSNFTNWARGEPNSQGNEDCGDFWSRSKGYAWNDAPCGDWPDANCVCEGCSAGQFHNGSWCTPCPPGTSSAFDSSGCTPCPLGHNADSGASDCRPEPNTVFASLPAPNLTAKHEGLWGRVHLSLGVAALPPAGDIYGGPTLSYVARLSASNVTARALPSATAACSLQQPTPTVLSISATVQQLKNQCGWKGSEDNDTVTLEGQVTIGMNKETDLWGFRVPVLLKFPKLTVGELAVDGQVYRMANFSSQVAFYDSLAYGTRRSSTAMAEEGEVIIVEHSLAGGEELLHLSLQRVWLSSSLDPADTVGMLDLTPQVLTQSSSSIVASDHVRFSFVASADMAEHCQVCALHVLSSLSSRADEGGSLPVPTYHAHAVAALALEGGGEDMMRILIAVVATFALTTLAICLFCILRRRCTWKASRQPDPQTSRGGVDLEEGEMSQDGGSVEEGSGDEAWALSPVTEAGVLHVLRGLLCVAQPEELGKGSDASQYQWQYNHLEFYGAWSFSSPCQSLEYSSRQQTIRRDIASLSREGLSGPCWKTKLEEATAALPSPDGKPLDAAVGEKWLLHGTKPDRLLSIFSEGLNPNLSISSRFGQGTYLAEDPEKIDQYVTADPGTAPELRELHQALFPGGGHPGGDLFYALVVRSTCGFACRTQDGDTNMDAAGKSLWAVLALNQDAQNSETHEHRMGKELAVVAGSAKHLRYHSLVCELGSVIGRFREFVIYHKNQMQVCYLVAYRRKLMCEL